MLWLYHAQRKEDYKYLHNINHHNIIPLLQIINVTGWQWINLPMVILVVYQNWDLNSDTSILLTNNHFPPNKTYWLKITIHLVHESVGWPSWPGSCQWFFPLGLANWARITHVFMVSRHICWEPSKMVQLGLLISVPHDISSFNNPGLFSWLWWQNTERSTRSMQD